MNLITVALIAGATCAAGGYVAGSRHGQAVERSAWTVIEKAREAAVAAEQREQASRMEQLQIEIETLRARPERIRTVTRTITVKADAECESLPPDWRQLWNAR